MVLPRGHRRRAAAVPRAPAKKTLGCLLVAFATGIAAPAGAAAFPRTVVATRSHGIARIAGVSIGGLFNAPTLAAVRDRLGHERSLTRRYESCLARWPGGLTLGFTTFGPAEPCSKRPLQFGTLTGRGWRIHVSGRTYRTRAARSTLGSAPYSRLSHGYVLAAMAFVGGRTPTVVAHVSGGRVRTFELFVGGAGD